MPFKVKATLVAWLGDVEKYPCHFCYDLGDEIIFDGECVHGRICPDLLPPLAAKAMNMHVAGPRYVDPGHWYPFWYAPPSVKDLSYKKYDGLGFKNVLQTLEEPPCHMRHLQDPKSFTWPPHPERTVAKDVSVICPDQRTSGLFNLEVIDLSSTGMDMPYFRRQMTIMDRVSKNQGIEADKIATLYDENEIMDIYPPLVTEMIGPLVEELELLDYMEFKNGQAFVTDKGRARVDEFIRTLPDEDRQVLKM